MASSLCITLAGLPITIELFSTSKFTYEFGAINTLFPIFICPTITAFVPIQTSFPIFGVPTFFPLLSWPIVTPVAILQFFPIETFSFIIILPKCPM